MHRYLLNFKVKSLMNLYQNDPLFHLISNATVIICNTSRFTAVSAVGACRYSTHKFYMKEKISEIVRDFCDLLLKVKTFQNVSFFKPLFNKIMKTFLKNLPLNTGGKGGWQILAIYDLTNPDQKACT